MSDIPRLKQVALIASLSFSGCVLLAGLSFGKPSPTPHKRVITRSSMWKPLDGWDGLRPGIDRLPKAMAKLGKPSRIDVPDRAYYFKQGAVMVGLYLESDLIGRVEVFPSYPDQKLMPKSMKEVVRRYGPLDNMGPNHIGGFTYKRRGLEVISDLTKDPEGVSMLGFYDPKLDDN